MSLFQSPPYETNTTYASYADGVRIVEETNPKEGRSILTKPHTESKPKECLRKMNYHPLTGGDMIHFIGENAHFATRNGCDWARRDSTFGKTYKLVRVHKNRKYHTTWSATDIEIRIIEERIAQDARAHPEVYNAGTGNRVIGMFALGGKREVPINRTNPRNDIYQCLKKGPCVFTGSCSDIEVDHKNDLYNDPRVADPNTQRESDFQPFTKHINDVKRSARVRANQTGVRSSAYDIPMLRVFASDLQLPEYIKGGHSFDKDDPTATEGTLWHDPIAFMKGWATIIKERMQQKDDRIAELEKRVAQQKEHLAQLHTI